MSQKRRRKSDLSFLDVYGAWGVLAALIITLLIVSATNPLLYFRSTRSRVFRGRPCRTCY